MADEAVRIEGLRAFVKAIKAADPEWAKEIKVANRDIAKAIAGDTKASFRSRSGVAPKVAKSVRVLAQQAGAAIKIGGDAYPYALGSEFGSSRFRQFPAWRGSGSRAGYSLYPSIRSNRSEIEQRYERLIADVAARAFPD